MVCCTFTDASHETRLDKSSQGGQLHVFADCCILDGKEAKITIVDWKSWKLQRVVRSSLAAEAQAFAEAQDQQEFINIFVLECLEPTGLKLSNLDEILSCLPASPIFTDCKSLYDALAINMSSGLSLSEKRTALEVIAMQQKMQSNNSYVKWVNSERQLADGLTKVSASQQLAELQVRGTMKVVFDPEYTAAKKLKAQRKQSVITARAKASTEAVPAVSHRTMWLEEDSTTAVDEMVAENEVESDSEWRVINQTT
jgi:hypothetical protein